jgi:hypothetical protein
LQKKGGACRRTRRIIAAIELRGHDPRASPRGAEPRQRHAEQRSVAGSGARNPRISPVGNCDEWMSR